LIALYIAVTNVQCLRKTRRAKDGKWGSLLAVAKHVQWRIKLLEGETSGETNTKIADDVGDTTELEPK
jgi:hypothetical protein